MDFATSWRANLQQRVQGHQSLGSSPRVFHLGTTLPPVSHAPADDSRPRDGFALAGEREEAFLDSAFQARFFLTKTWKRRASLEGPSTLKITSLEDPSTLGSALVPCPILARQIGDPVVVTSVACHQDGSARK